MKMKEIEQIVGVFKTNRVWYATVIATAEILSVDRSRVYQLLAQRGSGLIGESPLGAQLSAIRLSTIQEYQKQNGKK